MKTLTYSITIDKPKEFVFKKMIDKSVYPERAKAWGEGMKYEGEWKEGAHIAFFDETQGGTKVIVKELIPNELIKSEHVAMVNTEALEIDLSDEKMKKWIGSREDYYFKSGGDDTTIVEVVMTCDEMFEPMVNAWSKALEYFKEVCEKSE